jgi:hypothetical protein
LSDGQFIYFFFLSCSFECIHIEENFEYHLIPPSAVYSRFLPLAVSENALFEDESMLIFFNLQVAGYKDLTLPCPAPCPALSCKKAGQGKNRSFRPALLQGRTGCRTGQGDPALWTSLVHNIDNDKLIASRRAKDG